MTMYLIGVLLSTLVLSIGVIYYNNLVKPTADKHSKTFKGILVSLIVSFVGAGALFSYNQSVTNKLVEAKLNYNQGEINRLDTEIKDLEDKRFDHQSKYSDRDYNYNRDVRVKQKAKLTTDSEDIKAGRYTVIGDNIYSSSIVPVTK